MTTANVTDASRQNGHEKTMHDKTPEEIQLEIAQTRSAITQDLRVLSERFSPQQLREGAREVMKDAREEATQLIREAKEATVGSLIDAKDRAIESVKESVSEKVTMIGTQAKLLGSQVGTQARLLGDQAKQASDMTMSFVSKNALTVSLLGFGAGWVLMALRNWRRSSHEGTYANEYYTSAARPPRNQRISDTVRSVATTATQAADRARNEARAALQQTRDDYRQTNGVVSRTSYAVRNGARQAQSSAGDNKVAVVALTVAAGLGLSLLFPVARRPRRALLSAGERVWDGAQTTARQVADRARRMRSQYDAAE